MAINFNPEGGRESVAFKKRYYTGQVTAKVVAINPTKEEIKELGAYTPDQEPQYYNFVKQDGSTGSKLDIYFEYSPATELKDETHPKKQIAVLTINISKKECLSKTGKALYINDVANYSGIQSSWAEDEGSTSMYFDKTNPRKSLEGEVALYNFIYSLYKKSGSKAAPIKNFILGDDMNKVTEAFEDVCDGNEDFSFLKKAEHFNDSITILLGIKKTQKGNTINVVYHSAFRLSFGKFNQNIIDGTIKDLKESISSSPFEYQNDLRFKEYDPLASAEMNASQAQLTIEDEANASNHDVYDMSASDDDDDMPF